MLKGSTTTLGLQLRWFLEGLCEALTALEQLEMARLHRLVFLLVKLHAQGMSKRPQKTPCSILHIG